MATPSKPAATPAMMPALAVSPPNTRFPFLFGVSKAQTPFPRQHNRTTFQKSIAVLPGGISGLAPMPAPLALLSQFDRARPVDLAAGLKRVSGAGHRHR